MKDEFWQTGYCRICGLWVSAEDQQIHADHDLERRKVEALERIAHALETPERLARLRSEIGLL